MIMKINEFKELLQPFVDKVPDDANVGVYFQGDPFSVNVKSMCFDIHKNENGEALAGKFILNADTYDASVASFSGCYKDDRIFNKLTEEENAWITKFNKITVKREITHPITFKELKLLILDLDNYPGLDSSNTFIDAEYSGIAGKCHRNILKIDYDPRDNSLDILMKAPDKYKIAKLDDKFMEFKHMVDDMNDNACTDKFVIDMLMQSIESDVNAIKLLFSKQIEYR